MNKTKMLYVVSWVFAGLLAILFLLAGVGKMGGAMNEMFAKWGYPGWFATFIGLAEAAGAIGILIPRLTRLAIIGLTVVMFGAVYTHLAAGEELQVLRPIIFLVLLGLTWFFRSQGTESAAQPTASAG
jgi:uncharacterized membrane protein YphA (DoxX/SURF4 family)